MDELQQGTRHQLGWLVAERALERRVHALQVAVDAEDAQQVEREVIDVVDLPLGAAAPQHPAAHQVHDERGRERPRKGKRRQSAALGLALTLRPAGIILGGFDAAGQQAALRQATALGIAVVGWHAAVRPGPDPAAGLFTNVTTDPDQVAVLAASYVIAASGGTAGVVIFTDSQYAIETDKAGLMAATLKACRRCTVLQVLDTPIAGAQINAPGAVTALLETYPKRFTYLLAVNGAYITAAQVALYGAGVPGDQPPFSVAAGDGDAAEFDRIRAGDYQQATVAEPLYLQGWQLIDEINRARAGQPPSGYLAPPHLITHADVPAGPVFDPPSSYRQNYLRIWHR